VQLGSSELILEAVRGGHSLLWTNGRTARRHALGLADFGHLTVQLRAPKLPVHVTPRELMTLAPGARLAGYVQVSLVPTLQWHDENGQSRVLLEVHPEDLAAEWDEDHGHVLAAASPWLVRFPMRNGEPRVVVPIRLHNDSHDVCSPAALPMQLDDAELATLRGCIVARPRRLRWRGERFAGDGAADGSVGAA
jgi:hypothetical protein